MKLNYHSHHNFKNANFKHDYLFTRCSFKQLRGEKPGITEKKQENQIQKMREKCRKKTYRRAVGVGVGVGALKSSHDCFARSGVTEQPSQSIVTIMNILSVLKEH